MLALAGGIAVLDLSKPEHREALRWACVQVQRSTNLARELMGPVPAYSIHTEREGLWKDRETAVRTLSSPAKSAAIVRALVEGCGVQTVANGHGRPPVGVVQVWPHDMQSGTFRNDRGGQWVMVGLADVVLAVEMRKVPALILRLLAATMREEALAALREAGR